MSEFKNTENIVPLAEPDVSLSDLSGQDYVNELARRIYFSDPEREKEAITAMRTKLYAELLQEVQLEDYEASCFFETLKDCLDRFDGTKPFCNYFNFRFSKERISLKNFRQNQGDSLSSVDSSHLNDTEMSDYSDNLSNSFVAECISKVVANFIRYQDGLNEVSGKGRVTPLSDQRKLYFRLFFSEEMTDRIKRYPSMNGINAYKSFEYNLFKAMEPAFFKEFLELDLTDSSEQKVENIYTTQLREQYCKRQIRDRETGKFKETDGERYNHPIYKINDKRFINEKWHLRSWVFSEYVGDNYSDISNSESQISQHRNSERYGYDATMARWLSAIRNGGNVEFA